MSRTLVSLAAVALLVVPGAGTAERAPVLALAGGTLLRVDPVTLRPVGGDRLGLTGEAAVAARSPGGGRLAVSSRLAELTVVDLDGLRRLATAELPDVDDTIAIAWPAPRRILVARQRLRRDPRPLDGAAVDTVDPATGRVLSHRRLRWALVDAGKTPAGLVLLLQRRSGIGPARLARVDADGDVRTVALPGIRAGETTRSGRSFWTIARWERPALAVDGGRGRAYVVGRDRVVDVDLRTLRLRSRTLPLRRPAKEGRPVPGWTRAAHVVGPGRLALWGSDVDGKVERLTGPRVLDLRTWSLRAIDVPANALVRGAGGRLLAYGSIGDRGPRADDVLGVTAFDAAGRVRFRVLAGERAFVVETAGRYAYVYRRTARGGKLRSVVDLRTGAVVHTDVHVWRIPQLLPPG